MSNLINHKKANSPTEQTESSEIYIWISLAAIYILPKLLDKLLSFAHDMMEHNYTLKIGTSQFNIVLKKDADSEKKFNKAGKYYE